ncbi:response regulator [Pseudoxanthomonas daejeonensis]|uniref:LytR/AlgR family response regulator transcription factor n=1 Tax=Pseudoxanthomonas daejeonensis TaxID=266062 RepID=UPI001F5453BF|nr:response regulator [Pseudoxanthomonas daejeonensis]UNK57760.1 response regulator [Pseudoxanthomonas daejeonensis]
MTIRALIVDDEPVARRGIARLLRQEPDIEIVGECGDGAAAISAITAHSPDLVFLDVQMPELDGFAVIEAIGDDRMPAIVFVTAFDQHAVRAFDAQAIDYVLKPIDPERFRRALQRARSHLAHPDADFVRRVSEALESIDRGALERYPSRLAIRSEGRVRLLDVEEVEHIVAAGNYAEIHAGTKRHLLRETMTHLEARLDPRRFIRISRAAIVNVARIREIQPLFNGDFVVLLKGGAQVNGSRRYRAAIEGLLR